MAKSSCSKCKWWVRDLNWEDEKPVVTYSDFYDEQTVTTADGRSVPFSLDKDKAVIIPRIMGNCYLLPPALCQVLIPAVIKKTVYEKLRQKQEQFQIRPIMEADSFCASFEKKRKKTPKTNG